MNIILVPAGGRRRGRSISLSEHQIRGLLVGALVVPVLVGVLAYYSIKGIANPGSQDTVTTLQAQQSELRHQQALIQRAHDYTQAHLNALAQRLGQLQAQILRLNALSDQVAHVAGVDSHEFDFRYTKKANFDQNTFDDQFKGHFLSTFNTLQQRVTDQRKKLTVLEKDVAHQKKHTAAAAGYDTTLADNSPVPTSHQESGASIKHLLSAARLHTRYAGIEGIGQNRSARNRKTANAISARRRSSARVQHHKTVAKESTGHAVGADSAPAANTNSTQATNPES